MPAGESLLEERDSEEERGWQPEEQEPGRERL